jgi:predicted DNA-binding transcriptional regulator AlpA
MEEIRLPSQESQRAFITRKELAEICRCSLSTINRGIHAGRWPFSTFIRITPRRIVFPASIVKEIEARNQDLKRGNRG